MAQWEATKTDASQINGGNQFVDGQANTTNDFIANVQNNLYAVEQADLAQTASAVAQQAATDSANAASDSADSAATAVDSANDAASAAVTAAQAATTAATDTAAQLADTVLAAQQAASDSATSASNAWTLADSAVASAAAAQTSASNAEASSASSGLYAENISTMIQQLKKDGGHFNPATGVVTLTTIAQEQLGITDLTITLTNDTADITGYLASEGMYYSASAGGTLFGIDFNAGDWLCATASGWYKEYQGGAVVGIKGNQESAYRTGQINITDANILSAAQLANVNRSFTTSPITSAETNITPAQIGAATTTALSALASIVASKQDPITGAASTIVSNNLTAGRALISDGNGKVTYAGVSAVELSYIDGVTSNVQTQLNQKSALALYYDNEKESPASPSNSPSYSTWIDKVLRDPKSRTQIVMGKIKPAGGLTTCPFHPSYPFANNDYNVQMTTHGSVKNIFSPNIYSQSLSNFIVAPCYYENGAIGYTGAEWYSIYVIGTY